MLRELLSIFRTENPLKAMGDNFAEMLKLACQMIGTAGHVYFRQPVEPGARSGIYSKDVRVNQLERAIRKQVVTHLAASPSAFDIPYSLLLMSLVKDVERLGDYAKNLCEVVDMYPGSLPDDDLTGDLKEIRAGVEEALSASSLVFENSDREQALTLILRCKQLSRRAEGLLVRIARSDYNAGMTTAMVLGTRYYKRIGGHVINLLTSVVMPLHKIDYYDEEEIRSITE